MSYMKTIQKNRTGNAGSRKTESKHVGGIDLLIVSPDPGNPEPLFQVLRKEQVSSDAAKAWLRFLKQNTMPGEVVGWAWSFDG